MADQTENLTIQISAPVGNAPTNIQSVETRLASLEQAFVRSTGAAKAHGEAHAAAGAHAEKAANIFAHAGDGLKKFEEQSYPATRALNALGLEAEAGAAKIGALGGVLTSLGEAIPELLAIGAAVAVVTASFVFLKESVDEAAVSEREMVTIGALLKNQGVADYKERTKAVEEYAATIARTSTFQKTDALSGMQAMLTAGLSYNDMLRSQAAAMDLAAAKNVSLAEADRMLAGAWDGKFRELVRLGIVTREEQQNGIAYETILQRIETRMAGTSAAAMDTFSGKVQNLGNLVGLLKEQFGNALLPVMSAVEDAMRHGVTAMQPLADQFTAWANKHMPQLKAGATGFVDVLFKLAQEALPHVEQAIEKVMEWLAKMGSSFGDGSTSVEKFGKNVETASKFVHDIKKDLDDLDGSLNKTNTTMNDWGKAFREGLEVMFGWVQKLIDGIARLGLMTGEVDVSGMGGAPPSDPRFRQGGKYGPPVTSASVNGSLADAIQRASSQYGVDPALLTAVGMQESNLGKGLDTNGRGDGGHGYGVFQLDDQRGRGMTGPGRDQTLLDAVVADPFKAAGVAAQMLSEDLKATGGNLRAALSMYNSGGLTSAGLKYADSVIAKMGPGVGPTLAAAAMLPGTSDAAHAAPHTSPSNHQIAGTAKPKSDPSVSYSYTPWGETPAKGKTRDDLAQQQKDFEALVALTTDLTEKQRMLDAAIRDGAQTQSFYDDAVKRSQQEMERAGGAYNNFREVLSQKAAAGVKATTEEVNAEASLKDVLAKSTAAYNEANRLALEHAANTERDTAALIANIKAMKALEEAHQKYLATQQREMTDSVSLLGASTKQKILYYEQQRDAIKITSAESQALWESYNSKVNQEVLASLNEQLKAHQDFINTWQQRETGWLDGILRHTTSLRDTLKNIWNDILGDYLKMIESMIVKGSMFSSINEKIAGIFGQKGGGQPGGAAMTPQEQAHLEAIMQSTRALGVHTTTEDHSTSIVTIATSAKETETRAVSSATAAVESLGRAANAAAGSLSRSGSGGGGGGISDAGSLLGFDNGIPNFDGGTINIPGGGDSFTPPGWDPNNLSVDVQSIGGVDIPGGGALPTDTAKISGSSGAANAFGKAMGAIAVAQGAQAVGQGNGGFGTGVSMGMGALQATGNPYIAAAAFLYGTFGGPHWGPATNYPDRSDTQNYGQFVSDINGTTGSYNGTQIDAQRQYNVGQGGTPLYKQMETWANSVKDTYASLTAEQKAMFDKIKGLDGGNFSADIGIVGTHDGMLTLANGQTISVTDYENLAKTYQNSVGASGAIPTYSISRSYPDFNKANPGSPGLDPAKLPEIVGRVADRIGGNGIGGTIGGPQITVVVQGNLVGQDGMNQLAQIISTEQQKNNSGLGTASVTTRYVARGAF